MRLVDTARRVLKESMTYRLCGLLLLCLWCPALGAAQEQDTARVLFEEGVAFADEGRWPLAVERFRAALAAHPSNVIEFNLGLALTHTNQSIEAIQVLDRIAHRADVDAALRAEAAAAAAAQRLQIAEVLITYAGSTAGLTLVVDGEPRPLAQLEETMRFEPGTHTIELKRGEVPVARGTLRLLRGSHIHFVLEAVSPSTARSQSTPPSTPTLLPLVEPAYDSQSNTNLWLGLGIGGGLLVTIGTVSLVLALTSASSQAPYGGSLGTVEINQ